MSDGEAITHMCATFAKRSCRSHAEQTSHARRHLGVACLPIMIMTALKRCNPTLLLFAVVHYDDLRNAASTQKKEEGVHDQPRRSHLYIESR